jgi:hypothetical protein
MKTSSVISHQQYEAAEYIGTWTAHGGKRPRQLGAGCWVVGWVGRLDRHCQLIGVREW